MHMRRQKAIAGNHLPWAASRISFGMNRRWIPLMAGVAISLAAHVLIIAPAIARTALASPQHRKLDAQFEQHEVQAPRETPKVEPKRWRLGIDSGNPSAFTWVGFEEYQEHLAALAEVEQAAFAEAATEQGDQQPEGSLPEPALAASELQGSPTERESAMRLLPLQSAVEAALNIIQPPQPHRELIHHRPSQPHETAPQELTQHLASLVEAATVRHANESPSSGQPEASQSKDREVGTPADKESSPSSLIDVPRDQWQLGKPLAAEGLELKPRRPEMPLLTMLTAYPGNPVCEIEFNRAGVPVLAKFVTATGDRRVDDALLASFYRWRASGKRLESLAGDETFTVRIRLILTR